MRQRSWTAVFVCAAAGFAASPALGQDAQNGEFSVQRFLPAPGNHNFLTVEGARIDGHLAFSAGVFVNYASRPYVLQVCRGATPGAGCTGATSMEDVDVVRDLMTVDLLAAMTFFRRLQVGVRLPYMSVVGDGVQTDLSPGGLPTAGQRRLGGIKGQGIGDPMFELKVRIHSLLDDKLVFGASVFGTAPVGTGSSPNTYLGDSSATFGGRGIVDLQLGRLHLGANIGGVYRKEGGIGDSLLGSEMRYGVGASYQVAPLLDVIGEAFGSSRFSSQNGTGALEIDGAVKVTPLGPRLGLLAGVGTGVYDGMGVPAWRVLFGATYTNEIADRDGDGIADDRDACPTLAEDRDGFQDDDGCPDPDNDADGIPDTSDKCPNEPETKNGFQDDDGCPDDVADRDQDGIPDTEDKCPDAGGQTVIHRKGDFYGCPDRDKDGVPDKVDQCPDEPEDTDGYKDEDGCPDPDNDGDGVIDTADECPDQPEVMNGYKDEDGCPDEVPDRDHDGIPDNVDKCPDAPETYNGINDDDGCPDGPSLVDATTDQLKIKDVINFAIDSDKIVGKKSFAVLDAVAGLMKHHPEIFRIEVAGHTDDKGDRDHNVDLSKRRAEAVVSYLTSKGVESKRLSPAGYGPDKPIIEKKSEAARAKNRRVEFNVLQSTAKSGAPGDLAAAAPSASPSPAAPSGGTPAAKGQPEKKPAGAPAKPTGSGIDMGDL
jgi:OmpA-OmpF porin, OOP family